MESTYVRDWRGRAYLVSAPPPDRRRMFVLAWASMLAIAPMQYGYAAAVPTFLAGGRTLVTVLLPLAAWIVVQAITAFLLSTHVLTTPPPNGHPTTPRKGVKRLEDSNPQVRATAGRQPRTRTARASQAGESDSRGLRMRAQVAQSPSPHRREADDPGPRSRTAEEREPRASDADGRGPRTRTIEDRTPHTRDPHTRTAEDGVPLRGGSDGHGVRIRLVLGAGAGLSGIGLVTVAVSEELWALLLGFSLLGGVGGGLVYGVCSRLVAGWYPERSAARVGYVTGAFGYGALPLAVVAGATAAGGDGPWAVQVAFAVCAVVAVVAIGLAARFVRLAPRRWWPATVDPRKHALDATQLRRTPPAVREFTPGQALRTPALAVLVGILLCAGTISIFDVVMVAALGEWPALALLIALNGAGRSGAMRVSEVLGRRRTLALVLAVLGVGQVVLASGSIMGGAVVAGLGGGAFYPLVAALVREYFGEERVSEIHGVVYSAKALAGIAGVGLAGVILAGSALLGGTGTHGGSPSPGGNSVIGGGGPVRGTVLIPDLLSGVGHLGGAGLGGIGLLAGCVAFGAAAASLRLRVPGRPVTIPV